MARPEVKMIASIVNHMPLLTVWKESGVTDPYGFDLVVHLADRVLPGQPEIGMRGRSEKLLDGTYQFVSGLHFEPYYTRARGDKRLTYLAQAQNDWDDRIIAGPEIRDVHDLEGKSFVVTAAARCVYGNLRHSLELAGADLNRIKFLMPKDVGIKEAGPDDVQGGEAIDVVEKGEAVAANVDPPFDLQAEKRGLHLLDVPHVPVIHNCTIVGNDQWIKANEDTTIAFLKSMVDAIHFFKTQKQKSCEILEQHLAPLLGLQGPDEVEHLHAVWASLLSSKPFPHPLAVWNVYNLDIAHNPEVNFIGPFDVWDTSYLKAIDDSQYIDELWGGAAAAANPPVNAAI